MPPTKAADIDKLPAACRLHVVAFDSFVHVLQATIRPTTPPLGCPERSAFVQCTGQDVALDTINNTHVYHHFAVLYCVAALSPATCTDALAASSVDRQPLRAMSLAKRRLLSSFAELARDSSRLGSRSYANQPWDPKDPIRYWQSGDPASAAAPRSKRWLLHPWMPIDIRLPILVGFVGCAAYIYLERSNTLATAREHASSAWQSTKEQAEALYQSARDLVTGPSGRKGDDGKPIELEGDAHTFQGGVRQGAHCATQPQCCRLSTEALLSVLCICSLARARAHLCRGCCMARMRSCITPSAPSAPKHEA
jgi:hypothetical protein